MRPPRRLEYTGGGKQCLTTSCSSSTLSSRRSSIFFCVHSYIVDGQGSDSSKRQRLCLAVRPSESELERMNGKTILWQRRGKGRRGDTVGLINWSPFQQCRVYRLSGICPREYRLYTIRLLQDFFSFCGDVACQAAHSFWLATI